MVEIVYDSVNKENVKIITLIYVLKEIPRLTYFKNIYILTFKSLRI